ncbi:MAG TPA: sugar ABC transporter substrate-binding protein [Mobilitalea sp.]|nr:sugar ABC transporter substrate-binding protein [Mobilitalea sp.]
MKKAMAILISIVMCIGLLTGCTSKKESSENDTTSTDITKTTDATDSTTDTSSSEEEASAPVTIKVTMWGEGKTEQTLIDEFNKTNTKNITVELDAIPGDGYGDRLTTSFSSGDGYDIFLSGEGDFYKWVDLGMVADLDDIITADTEWTSPMDPSVLNMGKVEGKQDYMIKDYNPMCLWYNRDLFDQYGVEYPTADWTWDDLYAAAQKLTTKDSSGNYQTFGFLNQSWSYAVAGYLESKGISFISDDYSTADGYLNSQAMADALDWYFGLSEGDNRVSPTSGEVGSYGDGGAMLINGKLGMFISGGWVKSGFDAAGINYGAALIPDSHKCYYCASGFAVSSSCKNPEAAWEVLKYITGEEASELRVKNEAVFPTAEAQLQEVVSALTEYQKPMFESLQYSVPPVGMRGAVGSATSVAIGEAFDRIVNKDGTTIDILNDAVNKVNDSLK